MSYTQLIINARKAFVGALILALLGAATFFTFEPVVSRAVVEVFTISQSITAEISFFASTTDVTMSPSIPGVSGGTSNGSALVIVNTNNLTGYNMTLEFSTVTAMVGESLDVAIGNYTPTTTSNPDYNHNENTNPLGGEFAYSVHASTTADIDQKFLDNGSNECGTGSTDGADTCWYNASSTDGISPTAQQIMNSSSQSPPSGATSTILFRVFVPSSPTPTLPTDTYIATATLTAIVNP